MFVVYATIQIAILCFESFVQVLLISILLRGSIVGAIVYCDVYCPRHKQKRPAIPVRLDPDSGVCKNNNLDHNRLVYE